jgi:hypothetical protein
MSKSADPRHPHRAASGHTLAFSLSKGAGRLHLRSLLQNLSQDAPRVLQAPFANTIARIDGHKERRDTWRPSGEEIETEADIKAVEDLSDLVNDMACDASDDQRDLLDNLKADLVLQMHRLQGRLF